MVDLELMDGCGGGGSTHKIFIDNIDEMINFNPIDYFETDEKLLGNKTNRMKKSQLDKVKLTASEEMIKKNSSLRKQQYKKLSDKIANVDNLKKIANTLSYQKHLIVRDHRLIFLETQQEEKSRRRGESL
jgi:hypothetical protein